MWLKRFLCATVIKNMGDDRQQRADCKFYLADQYKINITFMQKYNI